MNFLSFSQNHLLFEIQLCGQAPGKFLFFTTIPSVRAKHAGRLRTLQCGSWPWRAAAPAKIPVILRRSQPGKGRRMARGSPTTDLWPKLGRGGSGGGVRRRQASAVTRASAPVSSRPGQENGRRARLQ
jgi:hypothetical protein